MGDLKGPLFLSMKKLPILVIGRNTEILATIVRLINNCNEWSAKGAQTDHEAIHLFDTEPFHIVLLGGGIEPESESVLREHFYHNNPNIPVVQHYGGGSGLLSNEILETIERFKILI
jgi:hypothetical protein